MSDLLKRIFLECCKFDKNDRFGRFLKVLGGVKTQKCRIFDGASFWNVVSLTTMIVLGGF